MTENTRQDSELTEKASDMANNEDEGSQMTEEKRNEGLLVVKSKIREKQPLQPGIEEEDTLGSLKGPKMSGSKLSKFSKYKRSKSKSNERSDSDVSVEIDKKGENLELVDQADNLPFEEKVESDETYAKAKKSLTQIKSSVKSSMKYDREDEDMKTIPPKTSEIKRSLNDDTQSTFLMSHNAEAQKEQSLHPPGNVFPVDVSSSPTRDSPTSSILKTPTAIFVTTRTAKTKRLTFANGPVDLQTLKNGTHESNVSFDSDVETNGEKKLNNGEISFEDNIIEVAISPVKTMKVSPETWKAFLEYKKYNDYPNETEKTDYTYSRLSKYRHKEIIPGFLIRPNLSRLSISSKRSSLSPPSSQTSLYESNQSKNYDFKVFNHSDSELFNNLNQPGKFVRSKYCLRSSNYDWKETGEADSTARSFVETDYLGQSPSEKITKSYAYTTTTSSSEAPEPTTHYYGKVRQMELDDADIDEVDDHSYISPSHSENRYYDRNIGWRTGAAVRPRTTSEYFKNFFTTIFLYIASVGTGTKDLFSKYILRRQDNWDGTAYAHQDWKNDNYARSIATRSWSPWEGTKGYSTANYYSDGYYGRSRSWPQRIYYYFYDGFSKLKNLIWADTVGYSRSRYQEPSRKRRFWWFFIPLLLLGGSFLGYIDFFSNPKAILNTMFNWVLFIPSFLQYTAMVFIPWLIFEALPYFILQAIPNFVTVALPYFVLKTVPYYFWVVVHFFAGLTLAGIWSMLVGTVATALNFLWAAGGSFYGIVLSLASSWWLFQAEQESGFLSDQYKALDCRTNGFLTSLEDTIKPVWRSGYIAYKRAAASASCYVNDSWERLKLPFSHIHDWLSAKLSTLSGGYLGFVFGIWNVLWQGLWNLIGLTRDTLSNLYFMGVFFTIIDSLGWIFGQAWKALANALHDFSSYLYLLLFAPRSEIKYDYRAPDASGEACLRQQKSIDKLTSEVNDFKSISWDLSSMKKKIDELEYEFRKEKELRKSQSELFDKQLDDGHKTLQKYQVAVNHALHSTKKPATVSSSSIQYLLDNHSNALKQWIAQNYLLKSDAGLDENKISLLIAKYINGTGEELLALKRELNLFVENHKNDLESLRKNLNSLEANNVDVGNVSLTFIKKLITDAIKLYDADKTGRVDYALETAGGQVESIRCTETYTESPKSYFLMGWPVYTKTSSPRDAISPGMAAGQCWAFVGSQGFLVLQLSHTIRVTGFTMEHISKSLVPRGHIESAPKNFSMWGLKHEHDIEPYLFGEYVYLDNDITLQYFPVTYPTNERFKMVELKIASNHGNPNYTCLYRIRVHGDVEPVHL